MKPFVWWLNYYAVSELELFEFSDPQYQARQNEQRFVALKTAVNLNSERVKNGHQRDGVIPSRL